MLTRIQIRATGPTAHEVEGELRWAAARLISDFGLTGDLTEQVIEGTPNKEFSGRLSIVITEQPAPTDILRFDTLAAMREAARS